MKKISIFLTLAITAVMLGGCYIPPPHYRAGGGIIHPRAARAYHHPVVRRYRHPVVRRYHYPATRPAPRIIVPPRRAVLY